MKKLTEGHTYELENFENKDVKGQVLQFIHKEQQLKDISELEPHEVLIPSENNFKLVTVADGTTNEDVLEVLIDRMNYLQSKFPCRENAIVITNLETALMWLEKRTKDRIKRNVEGKNIK